MIESVNKLYNLTIQDRDTHIGPASLFLLFLVVLIILLSFYTEKTILGRNWESNRCNNIFMSGFLQPNSAISPSEYTLKNLKYCIRQTIYNETPLLGHVKHTFEKIKYLLRYIKHQIDLYEYYIKINVNDKTQVYNKIMINKVNYLKYKQSHVQEIYDELDSNFKESINKVKTGVDNKYDLINEKNINDKYLDYDITSIINR
jgi:hypothetical protein